MDLMHTVKCFKVGVLYTREGSLTATDLGSSARCSYLLIWQPKSRVESYI